MDVTLKEFGMINTYENYIMGLELDENFPLHEICPPWFLAPLRELIAKRIKTISCGIDKDKNDLGIHCAYDELSDENKKIADAKIKSGEYRETYPYQSSGYYKERGRDDLMKKRCFRIFTKYNPNAQIDDVANELLQSIESLKENIYEKD